ncbi:MAG: bifunctional DNA-formamidopyrimidine glycosylase/DNA-(apurinic or apyrimidinic site) lyase [Tepidisphaeraceae bacterium]
MPELPEVETVVRTLLPRVVGRRILRVVHARPDMITPAAFDLAAALRGRTVTSLTRRGKRIVFLMDDANAFFIHLGMTGRLCVAGVRAPREVHTHLILDLGRRQQLRFRDPRRFGEIRWLGKTFGDDAMGPEPLRMRTSQLAARLAKTTRAIKNALMDQTVLAGLGNIYVDESLFAARIHPLTPANVLTTEQIVLLTKSIKQVLRRALRHRGSTLRDYVDADGVAGGFQRLHRVYDRKGKPCRKCKTPIERMVLGGRSTHFCPKCQPSR